MNQAYIALGTNIEPRETYLQEALGMLEGNGSISISARSSIYETVPVGYTEQEDFLNMVIGIETSMTSMELLDFCQAVELELGRTRGVRFGPRTIDLDILTYNQENSTVERLTLPHPRMHERAFVLVPLCEIAPELELPAIKRAIVDLMNDLPETQIKGVGKWKQRG